MRRMLLQDYLASIVGRGIRYVSGFNGSRAKCLHECESDGFQWQVAPGTVLSGHGCPECHRRKLASRKKVPLEDYLSRIAGRNTVYVSGYEDMTTKCEHRCIVHGVHWYPTPSNVALGKDCWLCKGDKQRALLRARHSEEKYQQYLQKRSLKCEGYHSITRKCIHECLVDGFRWEAKPHDIRQGSGCPKCAPYGFQQNQRATLYFLISDEGYLKIGITGEDTSRRMKRLAARTPFSFLLYREVKASGIWVKQKERELHEELASDSAKLSGFDGCTEWFRATRKVLEAVDMTIIETAVSDKDL